MKIDYELAEKIGATHWHTGSFDFYKEYCGELLAYSGGNWRRSLITPANAMLLLKPITKPRTITEYEKVTESIFDLREEFERGELYFDKDKCTGGIYASTDKYQKIRDMNDFCQAALNNNICRKVQKPVDWREEVASFVNDEFSYMVIEPDGSANALFSVSSKIDFPELCRVTLRALGEIE